MNDDKSPFIAGLVVGLLIAAIMNTMSWTDAGLYKEAKQECEKTLPRNQECKVIGVVK